MKHTFRYILMLVALVLASQSASAKHNLVIQLKGETEPIKVDVSTITDITFSNPVKPLPNGPFEVTVSNVSSTSATVSVVPNDASQLYYFDVIKKSDYDEANGDIAAIMADFLEFLQFEYGSSTPMVEIIADIASQGNASDDITGIDAETEYYAFAIGLDTEGNITTEAKVALFHTSKAGNPELCRFSLMVSDVTTTSAVLNIEPSEKDVLYYYGYMPTSQYVDFASAAETVRATMLDYAQSYGMSLSDIVEIFALTGDNEVPMADLTEGTHYTAFCYAIDSKTAQPACDYYEVYNFTTLTDNVSKVEITADCPAYYNGNDWYAIDPITFVDYKDKVYAPVEVTVDESKVMHWYVAMMPGDATDTGLYPEETTAQALVQGGYQDRKKVNYFANWGTATIMAVAQDLDGNYTKVYRKLINFTQDGASPIPQ